MSFLPQDYELPQGGGGQYTKLEQGENKLRILTSPVIGWLGWNNKTPIRCRTKDEFNGIQIEQGSKPKHFWALPVWNYKANRVEIWEVTQATILEAITNLTKNASWGSPVKFDLIITKSGQSLETSYTVMPQPHTDMTADQANALVNTPINLDALFSGGDPFASTEAPTPAPQTVHPDAVQDVGF